MTRTLLLLAGTATATLAAAPATAQPITLRDSFPIGSSSNTVCTAQISTADQAFNDMFDRGYRVVCRDAASPVATLYALRLRGGDPVQRLAALRREKADCPAPETAAQVPELGSVQMIECNLRGTDVGYRVYMRREGNTLYVAEGLAGYDDALKLGLRTLIADRPVPGEISVATTGAGDPAAFARAQAGTLDPRRALNEAYRRNNAGAYAESGEFFASLASIEERATRAEAIANQALQSSNLGRYPEAEAMFARAAATGGSNPVLRRRLRNYVALHLLNQGELAAAINELDRPLDVVEVAPSGNPPVIDEPLAERLNSEAPGRATLDRATAVLTAGEKIQILEGQRLQLRGTIMRLQGQGQAAVPLLNNAYQDLGAVRGGVVASTIWMRAQINGELAAIAEERGDPAEADRLYRAGIALLEVDYPGSDALLSARARYASFVARSNRRDEALALYRGLIDEHIQSGTGSTVLRRVLDPYFALLTGSGASNDAAADLFRAAQVAQRPGVAQTLAVLARELSAGSDEASRMFRQSVALTRDVERTRVAIARLQVTPGSDPAEIARQQAQLTEFQQAQTATQARLAAYPRFRAIAPTTLSLPELQAQLRPGEAYYKLIVLGGSIYAVLATPTSARAWKVEGSPDLLEEQVDLIRATILLIEDGETVTYPFDLETAHALYARLFGPVAGDLANVRHLIFEPDGAMLRLPGGIL